MTGAGAPVIVAADFGPADFAWLDRLRQTHFPAERNQLPAHLTLFHHLPPSLLPELDRRLRAETRTLRRPEASIGEPMMLGRGVALRVRCGALEALRERLAEAFVGLLTPQDSAGWRPHVTIQNKADPADAKALHRQMEQEFRDPRPLLLTGVATFFYRGGPWEPVARYRFAG
ncbi:2'-5' RNA ligase family protein [Sphingomonas abietis]|uniref:2'-5' RNA ligase family protein n=1 Tax=Sphingomonas abietis TaxID=3012344 RepID=A0ABY7NUK0_9SPHN|nr:2'-5' RNA ligase family protein [Sphingomonas abietis]WBO24106.1 2'-5' RNA ligase family protein [Sphingomonas abietis]